MKREISAAAAIMLAAAALTACGSASKSRTDSSDAATDAAVQTEAVTEAETAPEIQLETVRERDIISTDELFDYEVYNGGTIITKYKGNDANVEIPAEMGGAPVTEIGFYCFEAKYSLVSVTLPETIKTIGEFAFSDCDSLTSINIPDGVTEIQRGAFAACTSLSEMTLPASVSAVSEEAFTGCAGLTALYINNPDLAYESWGLEELDGLTVYAPSGSAAAQWAEAMGKLSPV